MKVLKFQIIAEPYFSYYFFNCYRSIFRWSIRPAKWLDQIIMTLRVWVRSFLLQTTHIFESKLCIPTVYKELSQKATSLKLLLSIFRTTIIGATSKTLFLLFYFIFLFRLKNHSFTIAFYYFSQLFYLFQVECRSLRYFSFHHNVNYIFFYLLCNFIKKCKLWN